MEAPTYPASFTGNPGPAFANMLYQCMESHVKEIEGQLKADEHLIIYHLDNAGTIHPIHEIGYHNPHLLILHSQSNENDHTIIMAHASNLQIYMKIIKKHPEAETGPKQEKRAIGFLGNVEPTGHGHG